MGDYNGQTVREALDEKRTQYAGIVQELVLCKRELFYLPKYPWESSDTVYPVSTQMAQEEAVFFGVPWSVQ